MHLRLDYGEQHGEVEFPDGSILAARREAEAATLAEPLKALRAALEDPLDYPPLRRALTPDDHLAVVVDESLPQLGQMLVPVLEHLSSAGVAPQAITLVCAQATDERWVDELPDAFQEVRVEVHQADDRRKLAYLATTKRGRRIYLNRSVVDADQIVVLSRLRYDILHGIAGGLAAIYPPLSDAETIAELSTHFSMANPSGDAWPLQREATEVVWQLGVPFLIQVIEGPGGVLCDVVAGPPESSTEAHRRFNAYWRTELAQRPDLVVATVTGKPEQLTADALARAFLAGARVVQPGGRVVVLSEGTPALGPSFDTFRHLEDAGAALLRLEQEKPSDYASGFQWASAASHAKLYLLSGLPDDLVEELYATPIQHVGQCARLLPAGAKAAILPDADRAIAVVHKR